MEQTVEIHTSLGISVAEETASIRFKMTGCMEQTVQIHTSLGISVAVLLVTSHPTGIFG
jgi:cytochrome b561